MIKRDELIIMRAVMIPYKRYLKPEEGMLYTNLGRTQFKKKTEEHGIYKNKSGYYKREELDLMLSGEANPVIEAAKKLKI